MKQYQRIADLAEEFGLSPQTVSNIVKTIRWHTPSRYSPNDIIGTGKLVTVRTAAFMDAMKYGDKLTEAPAYHPLAMERECGILPEGITETAGAVSAVSAVNAEAIADAVVKMLIARLATGRGL